MGRHWDAIVVLHRMVQVWGPGEGGARGMVQAWEGRRRERDGGPCYGTAAWTWVVTVYSAGVGGGGVVWWLLRVSERREGFGRLLIEIKSAMYCTLYLFNGMVRGVSVITPRRSFRRRSIDHARTDGPALATFTVPQSALRAAVP